MCDYEADPVWQGDGVGLDLETLPLSSATRSALRQWAASYEALPDSDESDAVAAFEREGIRLWGIAREELGDDWRVGYFSEAQQQKVWDPSELNSP